MFKFLSVARCSVCASLLAIGLMVALLPMTAQAASLTGGQPTLVEGGGCSNRFYDGNPWSCNPHFGRYGGPQMGYGMGSRVGHWMGYARGYGANVYVVQPGDTLSSIALRYGTSVWALMHMNQIGNPNQIYVGEVLRIA